MNQWGKAAARLVYRSLFRRIGQALFPAISENYGPGLMRILTALTLGVAIGLSLGACSETRFLDTMGMGKTAPDETQVARNQTLAMPPDLQLRAPSATAADTTSVPQQPATASTSTALPNPVLAEGQAPATGNGANGYDTGAQQLSTNPDQPVKQAGTQTASIDTGNNTAVQSTQKSDLFGEKHKEDAYQKYGISKTRPDGKPKTQGELEKELLAAIQAEKRKSNPNYGTVWNMGNIFSGN